MSSVSYYRNYCLIIIDHVLFFVILRCQGIKLKLFHLLVLLEVCENHLFNIMINYNIADFIARLHVASTKKIFFVKILRTLANLKVLFLLQKEGIIDSFRILNNGVMIFLKFDSINEFFCIIN